MVGDILQPTHLLFILVVALLVLGPKRLPEVGRSLGSGLRDFRAAISGESISHDEPRPQPYPEAQPYQDPVTQLQADPVAAPAPEPVAAADLEPVAAADPVADYEPARSLDDAQTSVLDPDPTAVVGYASGDATEFGATEPAARTDTSGFASALAANRQRPSAATAGDDSAPHE